MKDLPYFKFSPAEWNYGDISLCSMEAQGLFINLCSLYWSQQGRLGIAKCKRRYSDCNASAWKELISEEIIKVSGDDIFISFLEEQFQERKVLSKKNSENALERWKKDATASESHNEKYPNGYNIEKRRKEERREEKKRREEKIGEGEFFVTIKPVYLNDSILRIHDLQIYFENTGQLEQIKKSGWDFKFPFFMKANPGAVYEDQSHLYNAFKKFALNGSIDNKKQERDWNKL